MRRKYSILDCQEIASQKRGKCLSASLERVTDRVIWECSEGHQWEQRFHNIRRGTWCPICSPKISGEKRKLTIEEMKQIAQIRNGKCLSLKYINAQTKLLWECAHGHQWLAQPVSIKRGCWCLKCANMVPYTKQDLDSLAKKNNGQCLSAVYQKAKTQYIWQCHKGHIFQKSWDAIKNKRSWCPKCKGRGRTIDDLKQWAKKRGGQCLTTSFNKMQDRIQWECSSGHQWKATASSVRRGSWCPRCNSYYTEELCRFIFEYLTEHIFNKVRIPVHDEVFKLMELDGYSRELNLAFEYHGIQHYNFVPKFHKTIDGLAKIQEKDRRRKTICSQQNIKLIVVPFQESRLGEKHLTQFISAQLKTKNIAITGKVIFEQFYIRSSLEKLRQIALSKGGECLEDVYSGPHHRMRWRCKHGHAWLATGASVKNGNSWCPACARKSGGIKRRKHSLDEMKDIARQQGGYCLSKTYEGTNNKLKWECSKGHVFETQVMAVLKGQWCRKCRFPKPSDSLQPENSPQAVFPTIQSCML